MSSSDFDECDRLMAIGAFALLSATSFSIIYDCSEREIRPVQAATEAGYKSLFEVKLKRIIENQKVTSV